MPTQKEIPRASHGILDLTAWDFKASGPLYLNGEWEFYWKRHVPPEAFVQQHAPRPTGYITVPGIWNGYAVDGQILSGEGYATYRLQILLGSRPERLSFKFLDVATAFTVYVNGHPLFAAGVPGQTPQTTVPQFYPQAVDFQPTSMHLDIVVWVANFSHHKGGVWEAIRLGLVDDIRARREITILLDIFLLGSIMIMGLYHTGLFVLRKNERSSIYFALFCFLIAIRVMTTGERYLVQLIPNFNWEILVKITYLTFYLGITIFSMFVKYLFLKKYQKFPYSLSML